MLAMLRDDSAQGLVEYALIVAFIAIIAVVSLRALGGKTANSINSAENGF